MRKELKAPTSELGKIKVPFPYPKSVSLSSQATQIYPNDWVGGEVPQAVLRGTFSVFTQAVFTLRQGRAWKLLAWILWHFDAAYLIFFSNNVQVLPGVSFSPEATKPEPGGSNV